MIESKVYTPNINRSNEYITFDHDLDKDTIKISFSEGYEPFWENVVNGFYEKIIKNKGIKVNISGYNRYRYDIDKLLVHKFCCDDEEITITDEGTIFSMSEKFTLNRLALILYDIEQYDRMIFDEI